MEVLDGRKLAKEIKEEFGKTLLSVLKLEHPNVKVALLDKDQDYRMLILDGVTYINFGEGFDIFDKGHNQFKEDYNIHYS